MSNRAHTHAHNVHIVRSSDFLCALNVIYFYFFWFSFLEMVYSSVLKLTQGKINLIDFLVSVYVWLKIREVIGMSRISCAFIFVVIVVVAAAVIFFSVVYSLCFQPFFSSLDKMLHTKISVKKNQHSGHMCVSIRIVMRYRWKK